MLNRMLKQNSYTLWNNSRVEITVFSVWDHIRYHQDAADFVPFNTALHINSVTKQKRGLSEFEKIINKVKT